MTTPEKLDALRRLMKQHGMDAYVVVTDDFHGSEYVGAYFKARAFLSGFTGSAGTLVVMADQAALWTDGRYFIQAGEQLAGSTIDLMKMGQPNVPTIEQFLYDHLPEHGVVGFDGRTISNDFAKQLSGKLEGKGITFSPEYDLVDEIWTDRPALSTQPVWELSVEYAGLSREEKLAKVRSKMAELKADAFVVAALDEIAWLMNLRGDDVQCTPVFLAFLLLTREGATLCLHESILNDEIRGKLADAGVSLAGYNDIYDLLGKLPEGSSVLLDSATTNYRILQSIPASVKQIKQGSPIAPMKATKNPVEMEHLKAAHIKDGVAVTRFMYWLKHTVGKEKITELSAAEKIYQFRAEQEGFIGLSFDSIVAYGPHAAMCHYAPTPESDVELQTHGFCLADTGGQYLEGTTDITRTFALGEPTPEEKFAFTQVLRGHLNLGAAKFLHGICGANLDAFARMPLWENGLDYNHGTGHGVGYLLNVHEDPPRIHWKLTANSVLEEGMVVSNEPGLYLEDKLGIRHENLVLCRKGEENEYGQFMYFENLTMVPFDRDAIDTSLMSDREVELLNRYHSTVYAAISPYLKGDELEWLKEATAPMSK